MVINYTDAFILPIVAMVGLDVIPDNWRIKPYFEINNEKGDFRLGTGNFISLSSKVENDDVYLGWAALMITAPICAAPIVTVSPFGYFLSVILIVLIYLITNLTGFDKETRYYLYRPNEYVNMYEDPKSRHWLVPGGGPGL